VVDNTGVKSIRAFGAGGNVKNQTPVGVGDVITGVIHDSSSQTLKRGMVIKALIIQSVHGMGRVSGTKVSFDANACVIWNMDSSSPVGNRITAALPYELRKVSGGSKVLSMAELVI
jgi:ribosomal protein L14